MRSYVWIIAAFLGIFSTYSLAANSPTSFAKSKRILAKDIYFDNPVAFYSGCQYVAHGKKLVPEWDSCGYSPRKNANRGSRIEWEHVMPAYWFGHQLQCWQDGGRKACKKNDRFRMMEADLHNLVPAIGEINGDRSNFRFSSLPGEPRVYGDVDFEVDFKLKKAEPAPHIRGDIARIHFYMTKQYGLKLSRQQLRLFQTWHEADPVDAWEIKRNQRIAQIQGNSNSFVSTEVNEDIETFAAASEAELAVSAPESIKKDADGFLAKLLKLLFGGL